MKGYRYVSHVTEELGKMLFEMLVGIKRMKTHNGYGREDEHVKTHDVEVKKNLLK